MEEQKTKKLIHKHEFARLISAYRPNNDTLRLLENTRQVLLVGPTGSGRNTVIAELLKTGNYHQVVSDTTRSPRINLGVPEKDGVEYWFLSEEEFLYRLKKGDYIEAAIIHDQQVSGVSVGEIKKAAKDNKIAINEVEIHGAKSFQKLSLNVVCIFLLPPSLDKWMLRLQERGHLSPDELHRRLTSAVDELTTAISDKSFILIENNDLTDAVREIDTLLRGNQSTTLSKQKELRNKARQLVQTLRQKLEM